MTNEEIAHNAAWQIREEIGFSEHSVERITEIIQECLDKNDAQFKEYLEKKENEFLKCTREDFLGRHFDVCGTLISEIINELFGGE